MANGSRTSNGDEVALEKRFFPERLVPANESYVIKKIDISLVTGQATEPKHKEKLKKLLFDNFKLMQDLKHENLIRVYSTFMGLL